MSQEILFIERAKVLAVMRPRQREAGSSQSATEEK